MLFHQFEQSLSFHSIQFIGEPRVNLDPRLVDKLKCLEDKIIVGGENLLEKAELQEKLLAESEAELEARK